MFEDWRLLNRLQKGDKDALRQIYEKYAPVLTAVALTLVTDIHTAEDCLHDAFVDFASKAPLLRIRGNLRSYLISCVANRARDLLRKKGFVSNIDFEKLKVSDCPDNSLITNEEAQKVYIALEQLPYEQREVFVLHVKGDLTFREISESLGESINTVQSRYRYGIEKLKSLLNTECEYE